MAHRVCLAPCEKVCQIQAASFPRRRQQINYGRFRITRRFLLAAMVARRQRRRRSTRLLCLPARQVSERAALACPALSNMTALSVCPVAARRFS